MEKGLGKRGTSEKNRCSSSTFGFNGMEKDDELKGQGNSYDFGARIYDSRLGRFLSIDPYEAKFPWYTPYQFAANRPISKIDLDGLEEGDPVVPTELIIQVASSAEIARSTFEEGVTRIGESLIIMATNIQNAELYLNTWSTIKDQEDAEFDTVVFLSHGVITQGQEGTTLLVNTDDAAVGDDATLNAAEIVKGGEANADTKSLENITSRVAEEGTVIIGGCAVGDEKDLVNAMTLLTREKSATLITNKDYTFGGAATITTDSFVRTTKDGKTGEIKKRVRHKTTSQGFRIYTEESGRSGGWQSTILVNGKPESTNLGTGFEFKTDRKSETTLTPLPLEK